MKAKDLLIIVTTLIVLTLFFGCDLALAKPSNNYRWRITKVIDGDTVKVKINSMPPELRRVSIRLRGVDTPEKGWR